jgi:hypothetical protein
MSMRRARTAWLIGGILVVATAAICAPALARGPKGHGGGSHDGQLWLLARAAGVPRTQIMTAFQNDANLKSDFANVRTTRQALQACLLSSPNSCSSQISAFGSAVQALSQERMNVWATVFVGEQPAPWPRQCGASDSCTRGKTLIFRRSSDPRRSARDPRDRR